MQFLQLLQSRKVAVQRSGVRRAADARKVRVLIVGPGIGNGAPSGSGIAKGIAKMGELVGNAVGLEISDVKAGKINAPFFEIAADHVGVVAVLVIFVLILLACEKRNGKEQREQPEQQAGEQERKHAARYKRRKTTFHSNHLGMENTNAATIDLYTRIGNPIFCWGF